MDALTIFTVVSGLFGIIGVVIQILIEKDRILAVGKTPGIQKSLKFFILVCFTFAIFGFFIYPSTEINYWQSSKYKPASKVESKPIRLQQEPASSGFRTTTFQKETVLLDEVFPTALAVSIENNQKTYLAGTYRAGIFASTQPPNWQFLGLDDLVITDIVVDPKNPYLIWAATNLGVAFSSDHGKTWSMTGPVNDLVTDLTSDPSNPVKMMAGTLHGAYVSTDGGLTWVGPTLDGEIITSINLAPSNPERIYVGCIHGKIYRSDDGGNSWNMIREADDFGSAPIAIDPDNPDVLYIGPNNLGLFRSTNAGQTWDYMGLKGTYISSILISNVPQRTISIGTDQSKGLFVSKDDGNTWQNPGNLTDSVITMMNDTDARGAMLVTTKSNGILETRDFGSTWSSMGLASFSVVTDFSPNAMQIRGDNPGNLIANSYFAKGVFESSDSGASWSPLAGNSDLLRDSVTRILLDPANSDHFIVSTSGGNVFETSNNGNHWKNITANLPLGGFASLGLSSTGTLYAGPNDQGVWKKSLNDNLWSPAGLMGYSIESISVGKDNESVYAFDNGGVLHVSYNEGESWAEPQYSFRTVKVSAYDETLIGILDDYEVLITTDHARTWKKIKQLSPTAQETRPSITFDAKSSTLYISYDKVLLRSKDLGTTWDELKLPEYGAIQLALGSRLYFLGDKALYMSDDYGQTFAPVKYQSLISTSTQQVQFNDNIFLLGTLSDGIFASFDKLHTWSRTSVGNGKTVIAMKKFNVPEPHVVALLGNADGVEIATSKDGRSWSTSPTPCKGFTDPTYLPGVEFYKSVSNYFGVVTDGEKSIWQVECSNPRSLLVIRPDQYESPLVFSLKGIKSDISDALLMPDNSIYVLTQEQNENKVYISSNLGKRWNVAGEFSQYYQFELSDDSRSDGILLIKEGNVYGGSFHRVKATPIIAHLAFILSVVLCFIVAFSPNVSKELAENAKWLLSWFTQNPDKPNGTVSRYYVLVVGPLIILLSILFFQITSQIGTLAQIISYQSFDKIANLVVNLIMRSKFSLFTLEGAVFAGILLIYIFVILITSFVLTLFVPHFDPRKILPTWFDSLGNGFALFTAAIPIICILSSLLNYFSDSLNQRIFGLGLLGIVNLWFVFLWFRVLAVMLYRISQNYGVSIREMVLPLVAGCVVTSIGVQFVLLVSRSSFAPEVQPLIESIPALSVGLLTSLLILLHSIIIRSNLGLGTRRRPLTQPATPPPENPVSLSNPGSERKRTKK